MSPEKIFSYTRDNHIIKVRFSSVIPREDVEEIMKAIRSGRLTSLRMDRKRGHWIISGRIRVGRTPSNELGDVYERLENAVSRECAQVLIHEGHLRLHFSNTSNASQ